MCRISLLSLLFFCFVSSQSPLRAQEPDQDAAVRSIAKKLDLLLERMGEFERRLQKLERNRDGLELSLLRPSDDTQNAGDPKPLPLSFDFAPPILDDDDGELRFKGIEEGMRIDALERELKRSRIPRLQQP